MCTLSRERRECWLQDLLAHVETKGWTHEAAMIAAREAGLSDGEKALAAPNGVSDLIDHFFAGASHAMVRELAARDLERLRMHERVALSVKIWLDILQPHRLAVRRAAGHAFLPPVTGIALRRIWHLADTIWNAVGDTATDYNLYTKRALLAAVLPDIIMYWVNDPDEIALDAHITKRLQQAMQTGRAAGQVVAPILGNFGRLWQKYTDEKH